MAASDWGTDRRLDESLFTSGWEFDFFQAVRLLTLRHEQTRAGASGPPSDVLRFRAHNSLAFPASAIANIQPENGSPPCVEVTFLGMTGPEGALPSAYTEIAIDRECFGDRSFAEFLDIFNDRLIRLFFEAWKKHHFIIGYEQFGQDKAGQDEFTSYLFDLIGMGTAGLRDRMAMADIGLLHYAGLLAQRPHAAESLRAVLKDYFGIPVRVEQFLGKWHPLETDELCSLGSDQPGCQLGAGSLAGDAVWSRQILVRIVLGPLTIERFRDFLPDGRGFARATSLIRWFLGSTLEFEIQPTLRRDEVPQCRLGDQAADGSRLGWSAWVGSEPFWPAATDAVFREDEIVRMEA